ncbi:MAG: hypothetical protein R3Y62_07720, partial [Eubacteriales bacterium]
MEDLEGKIGQILADPEAMSNIFNMVQGLGLTPPVEADPPSEPEGLDMGSIPLPLIAALTSSMGESTKEAALFGALRPFLKPERQAKLD